MFMRCWFCGVRSTLIGISSSGSRGLNCESHIPPDQPQIIIKNDFVSSVTRYKMYLIKNWKSVANFTSISNILNTVETENYDLFDLIEELTGLEDLYFKMPDGVMHFYDALLNRIADYANIHNHDLTLDTRRTLRYIYATALSKTRAIKRSGANRLIVSNLSEYLRLIRGEIRKMKEIDTRQAIISYRNNYREILYNKIRHAQDTIDALIVPDIGRKFNAIHQDVLEIVDKINNMKIDIHASEEKLKEERSELRDKVVIHKALSIVKIIGAGVTILGPVGEVVGPIIGTSATIADTLVDSNEEGAEAKSLVPHVEQLARSFYQTYKLVRDKMENKKQEAKKCIDDATKQVDELLTTYPEEKELKNVKKDLTDAANVLNEKQDQLSPNRVNGILGSLKLRFQEARKKINVEKIRDYFERGQRIFNLWSTASELMEKKSNDENRLTEVDDAIEKAEKEFDLMNQLEVDTYNIMMPRIEEIKNSITTMQNQMKNESHVALDMSRWRIKEMMTQVHEVVLEFTSSDIFAKFKHDFEENFNKIGVGMNLIIDMYDRMDSYKDDANLAAYIADVSSGKPISADPKLNKKMTELSAILQSNIILRHYEMATSAFKQHYFPFASMILNDFELPKTLLMRDTQTLITQAADFIGKLSTKILQSEITFGEYDSFINTQRNMSFYKWTHNALSQKIEQLLTGKNVTLNADINGDVASVNNAVKFKDLQFVINLKNSTLQDEFNAVLNNFSISLEMIDNCYYRCNNATVSFSTQNVVRLYYSFEQDMAGRPMTTNEIYSQISRNEPFLSPYTTWNVQLRANNANVTEFSNFAKFMNEPMDFELMGVGKYIDQELNMSEFCKFY